MEDKLQKVPSGLPATPQQAQFRQDGNDNVMVPNYGTVNITVQQMPNVVQPTVLPQMTSYQMPMMPGGFYVPSTIDREYYNIFVLGIEEFDKPYTKIDKAQKHIRVKFAAGEKTFIFPDAFKQGFLKTK